MRILASATAHEQFQDVVSAPGVGWVLHRPDGTVTDERGRAVTGAAEPDVAWVTADILYDGSAGSFWRLVDTSPSIRWVQSSFAGLDVPLYPALLTRGCRVTTSHENSIAIAEYVIASVLRTYQMSSLWEAAQAEREWLHHEFREIHGTTWLIVGMGAIGTATAERLAPFGVEVVGVRRRPRGDEPAARVVRPDEMLDQVPGADVVVLAAPGTAETDAMVNRAFLERLRDGAVLVNIARGSLIDDAALLDVLPSRPDLRVVLDVFVEEPLPSDHPYWTHPQVTVTPHASSGGLGRHRRNATLFARNLENFSAGAPLLGEIFLDDLPAGERGSVPAQFTTSEPIE